MQFFANLVLIVQLLSALAIIGLVLVQHGKGADMGASFGSGASGSLFGATGSANFLSRSTAVCATIFFICTLALAFMVNSGSAVRRAPGNESVLDRPAAAASAPSAPLQAQIPGAAPAPQSSTVPAPAQAASAGEIPGK